jgi:radical SAM protein with 4Fe4S-binding SPASM domain
VTGNLPQVLSIAREANVTVKLNMVVLSMNYQQMPDVVSLAAKYGVAEVYLNRLNPLSIDRSLFSEPFYRSDDFLSVFQKAIDLAHEVGMPIFYPKSMQGEDSSLCKYPWNSTYVTWDGYMVPCCAKPFPKELNFGNVFESGFLACLNSEPFVQFRQSFKDGKIPEFCSGCC